MLKHSANSKLVPALLTVGLIFAISQLHPVSAIGTVTVSTDKSSYQATDTIHIKGTVGSVIANQALLIQVTNPNGALYRADIIQPASDGTFSYDLKIGGKLGPSGTYMVKVTYDQVSSTTSFTFTASSNGQEQTATVNIGGTNYQIQYMITGGRLVSMTADTSKMSLTANIDATSSGSITLVIPRSVMDAKGAGGNDANFTVLVNGAPNSNYTQSSTTDTRTLTINFNNGTTQVQIVGTHIVPEFGPLAGIVLVIAVIGTIVASTRLGKNNNIFSGNRLS
jgi:hypothetical protein